MKRISALSTAILFAFATAACGGGETGGEAAGGTEEGGQAEAGQAAQAETGSEVSVPDWMTVDEANQTVTLDIIAGQTTDNNSWNFNGYFGGEGEILVPQGYEVTINFSNEDQNMAHSIGVGERRSSYPANFSNPQPVFEGGISSNPTSLTEGTMPGDSETVTFTAATAGEYALICYVPGHAAVGMYMDFTVTTDGTVGFRE